MQVSAKLNGDSRDIAHGVKTPNAFKKVSTGFAQTAESEKVRTT